MFFIVRGSMIISIVDSVKSHNEINVIFHWAKYRFLFHMEILVLYWHLCNNYSLCLKCFHLLAWKPNLEKNCIYLNKFFHNFHLSECSFTCPGLQASGFAWILRLFFFSAEYHVFFNPFWQLSGQPCLISIEKCKIN